MNLEESLSKVPEHLEVKKSLDLAQVEIWLQSARLLLSQKDLEFSQVLIENALLVDPYCVEALRMAANICKELNKTDQQIEYLERAESLDPCATGLVRLAHLYYTAQNDEKALEYYFKFLSYGRNEETELFEVYKSIGNIFTRKRDFESAEEYYNKAYTLNPRSDVLFVNFGTLEIQKDELDLAKERFKSALEINANNDKAWIGLALVHRQYCDFELSWGNLMQALDLNSLNKTALSLAIQWNQEDQTKADLTHYIKNYLEVYPEDKEIRSRL